ncbi:MAG: FMN-binding protein [Clostridia bacterium]|nr:FMN-binding protein [Clostridia bacterium]
MSQPTVAAPHHEESAARLGIILGGIAFFVALVLSVVFSITEPLIEMRAKEKEQRAFAALFPTATEFREVSEGDGELTTSARLAYEGETLLGVVTEVHPRGYGGEISMLIGFDRDLAVTGISFLSIGETPGIGSRVTEEPYLSQYIGQSDFSGVHGITGASVSSKAIYSGVTAGAALAAETLSALPAEEVSSR